MPSYHDDTHYLQSDPIKLIAPDCQEVLATPDPHAILKPLLTDTERQPKITVRF